MRLPRIGGEQRKMGDGRTGWREGGLGQDRACEGEEAESAIESLTLSLALRMPISYQKTRFPGKTGVLCLKRCIRHVSGLKRAF